MKGVFIMEINKENLLHSALLSINKNGYLSFQDPQNVNTSFQTSLNQSVIEIIENEKLAKHITNGKPFKYDMSDSKSISLLELTDAGLEKLKELKKS